MNTLLLALALSMPADAGKLAEGFRDIPYGPAAALDNPPDPACTSSTEEDVLWKCPAEIGGVPVTVGYMVAHGLFYGVGIAFQHGSAEAVAFRAVLEAAYGPGAPQNRYATGSMDDWSWRDEQVVGSFDYNQFNHSVVFVAFDLTLYQQVQAAQKVEAAKAVGDL